METLQKYADFKPTPFDATGLGLPDQQDWGVAPVAQTRDSDALEQSNFETFLNMLRECGESEGDGTDGETWEVHRFGHWGPGWFEVVLVKPGSKAYAIAVDCARALENYPVLDDQDFSNREHEEYSEAWDNYARREFCDMLKREFGLYDAGFDTLDDCDSEALREFFEAQNPCGDYYSDGVNLRASVSKCTRDSLAAFIRKHRAGRTRYPVPAPQA